MKADKFYRLAETTGRSLQSLEARCCSVYALAAAAGVSYDEAHKALTAAGRKPRKGVTTLVVLDAAKRMGMRVRRLRPAYKCNEHSALELVRPFGRYLVRTKKHFYAIVNGAVIDSSPGSRARQLLSVTELSGTARPLAPLPEPVKPTLEEKRSKELSKTLAAIERWERKAKRAANALKKLTAKQRRLEKLGVITQ